MSSLAVVSISNTSVDIEMEFFDPASTVYVGGFVGYISSSSASL